MEVYALVGPSGTGKSTCALQFAYNNQIFTIIDDGLLIYQGKKVAGRSAKYEKNTITAIKRATFYFKDHEEEVIKELQSISSDRILILGTSKKMVDYIAHKLNLGKVDRYIQIEDIRSSREIKMAMFIRKTQGEHTIPIPSIQVEKSFLKKMILKGPKVFSLKKELIGENTIVYPGFQMGTISISPDVLKKIVEYSCKTMKEVVDLNNIQVALGNLPYIHLKIKLKITTEQTVLLIVKEMQKRIKADYQKHLDIELDSIHIHVEKLFLQKI